MAFLTYSMNAVTSTHLLFTYLSRTGMRYHCGLPFCSICAPMSIASCEFFPQWIKFEVIETIGQQWFFARCGKPLDSYVPGSDPERVFTHFRHNLLPQFVAGLLESGHLPWSHGHRTLRSLRRWRHFWERSLDNTTHRQPPLLPGFERPQNVWPFHPRIESRTCFQEHINGVVCVHCVLEDQPRSQSSAAPIDATKTMKQQASREIVSSLRKRTTDFDTHILPCGEIAVAHLLAKRIFSGPLCSGIV